MSAVKIQMCPSIMAYIVAPNEPVFHCYRAATQTGPDCDICSHLGISSKVSCVCITSTTTFHPVSNTVYSFGKVNVATSKFSQVQPQKFV